MPLYMDTHDHINGLTGEAARVDEVDTVAYERYGAHYLRCWFDQTAGKVFCIIEAPSKEAAIAVHREVHGLVADKIVEVKGGFHFLKVPVITVVARGHDHRHEARPNS